MILNYTPPLRFSSKADSLPPENIEAEEAILGGILIDGNAIYRIKDKLEAEHFYIDAHKEIYKATIKLSSRNQPTDLLSVINYLKDKGKLEQIGGRNKLASLIDRTVSAVNIDHLADLVIKKYTNRQAISFGHQLIEIGHDNPDIEQLQEFILSRTEWFKNCNYGKTKDDIEIDKYNRLLDQLKEINLGISDPGLKFFKLQELARKYNRSPRDLDNIYQKSLCGKIGERLTLDQLEESLGDSKREFLIGGLVPKSTSLLVYADGGVGKTKFLYDLAYCMATGQNWNGFPVTATNRKILIYQGDESKRDMLQALNKRGFKKGSDSRNHIQTRFGWNFDAIPALVKDIEEFKPDIVFVDSLTYANRYSIYDENRTEYARPVLELTSIAEEYGVTIVIVHHSSRGSGKPRGTTAIFNAVSEVYKLEKDVTFGATSQEKVLTIEKSRSRRFPCSYKLAFEEEDFSLHFLEEVGEELNNLDSTTKDRIVDLLLKNKNTKFEAEEVSHLLNTSSGNARRCLNKLHRDGMINCDEISDSGTKKLYYIAFEDRNCSIYNPLQNETVTPDPWITRGNPQNEDDVGDKREKDRCIKKGGSPPDHPPITLPDHLCNNQQKSDSSKGDPSVVKNSGKKVSENSVKKEGYRITFAENEDCVNVSEGDPGRRSPCEKGDRPVENFFELNNQNVVQNSQNSYPLPPPLEIKHRGNFGETVALVTPLKLIKKGTCLICKIKFTYPDGSTQTKKFKNNGGRKQLQKGIEEYTNIWEIQTMNDPECRWDVQTLGDDGYLWVEGCEMTRMAHPESHQNWYFFKSPNGEELQVAGVDDFRLARGTHDGRA